MKKNEIQFRVIVCALVLFFVCSVGARAQELSVTRAEIPCSNGKPEVLNVMFDKSLRAIRAEAQAAVDAAEVKDQEKPKKALKAVDDLIARLTKDYSDINTKDFNSFYIIKLEDGTRYSLTPRTKTDVMSLSNVLSYDILEAQLPQKGPGNTVNIIPVQITVDKGKYAVVATGISKSASLMPITLFESCKAIAEKLPEPTPAATPNAKSIWDNFVAVDKDADANFVGTFSIDGTKRTRRYFTTTVKFALNNRKRFGFGGVYNWNWAYANLNVTRNKQDEDVDTLEIGTKLNYIRVFRDDGRGEINHQEYMVKHDGKDKFAPGLAFQFLGKIETDWRFKVVNLAPEVRASLPLNLISTRSRALRLEPFVGFTLGRTIKGLENETTKKNPWIVRPSVGADLYFSPYRKNGKLPVVLTIGYVRRWPLFPEPFELTYENALGKKIKVKGVSSRVRDYASAKIDFDFGKMFSPFLVYEWGRQTPNYVLINSRYNAGIKLRFKLGGK